ncbi:MAG: hypothetical protein WB783_00010 [Arenicellales bacterium]
MDFSSRFATRQLTVLAQDPSVRRDGKVLTVQVPVPKETLAPGPKGYRVHVVDFDATRNRYYTPRREGDGGDRYADLTDPDEIVRDRHFHAQNVYALVGTTLLQFEAALGRHVSWGFPSGAHHIKVAPHAFADANAYYSRRDEGIVFGYTAGVANGRGGEADDVVFTCLSSDIVVHETTHAILDGLRSELMRASTPDQPAFHEGFADIVALLSTLARADVIRLVLPARTLRGRKLIETGALRPRSLARSVLLGLAEQFGTALAQRRLANLRGGALRRSVELEATGTNYADLVERDSEPHLLGEVLVAAVMNAFLAIWWARAAKLDPTGSGFVDWDTATQQGAKAAQHLLHMVIRAIDYVPPTNIVFPDFLSALLTVDHELVPGDELYGYRGHIRATFARYGILPASGKDGEGFWDAPQLARGQELIYGFSGHAEMQWDREAVMRFIWENRRALKVDADAFTSVNAVRPVVRIGPDGFLLRETVVEYFQLFDVKGVDLAGLRLRKPPDMPASRPVRLLGGGTLIFDDYGSLKFHIGTGVLSRRQNDRVASLWSRGDQMASRRFEYLHRRRMIGGQARRES